MLRFRLFLLTTVVLSGSLHAQTFRTLLHYGDVPPAGAVVPPPGVVTSIHDAAVNSAGEWILNAKMTQSVVGVPVLIKNGATFAKQYAPLAAPAGGQIRAFGNATLNNLGTSGWNMWVEFTTPATDQGIFVDTNLVLLESTISNAPQFSPNTPYGLFYGARWNDSRQILTVVTVDDPAIAGTTDFALVRLQLDASNALVSETVLSKEGDLIGPDAIVEFGTYSNRYAFNNQGNAIWIGKTNAPTTLDGVILVDGAVVAHEGFPAPVPGRWYLDVSSGPVDISDGGHTLFKAVIAPAASDDVILVRDGAVFRQTGTNIPAIGAFAFTSFGPVARVDSSGRVFWTGRWNNPNPAQNEGIFMNDTLLVKEGVTTIGGLLVQIIHTNTEDTLTISPDGRYVIFLCLLNSLPSGPLEAAVMIDLGPNTTSFCAGDGSGTACPCGNSGAPGRGCASSAFAGGALLTSYGYPGASAASDTFVLKADDIPGPGQFFQGDAQFGGGFGIPFGDGLLCAGGTILRLGVVFPTGTTATYPGGLTPNPIHVSGSTAPGDVRHYQCWYRDSVPFCAAATSNLTQSLTATWLP